MTGNRANLAQNAPTITIDGTNFAASLNTVVFSSGSGTVSSASTTQLIVTFSGAPPNIDAVCQHGPPQQRHGHDCGCRDVDGRGVAAVDLDRASNDSMTLAAVAYFGAIYTSADVGVTWTVSLANGAPGNNGNWSGLASM